MKFNLKDLDIKKISLVSRKARPANNKAKIAFIKSQIINKEETKMKLTDLIRSYVGKKEEVQKVEEVPAIETQTPEFVSKTEFAERMTSLEALIKDSLVQKSEETNKMNEFISKFAEAYETDIAEVKSSVIKVVADARRSEVEKANKGMGEQEGFESLLEKSSIDPLSFFTQTEGTTYKGVIEKGIKDGTLKNKALPKVENSFKAAIAASVGL